MLPIFGLIHMADNTRDNTADNDNHEQLIWICHMG